MRAREAVNAVLHVAGGAAISFSIMWLYWLSIPAMFVVGFLREQAQHRDEGFFGWINGHRMVEALQWPAGALLACLVWALVSR